MSTICGVVLFVLVAGTYAQRECNTKGVQGCYQLASGGDPCGMMGCMVDALGGCDDATIQATLSDKTATAAQMEASYQVMCGNTIDSSTAQGACSQKSLLECYSMPEYCEMLSCQLKTLDGCGDDNIQELLHDDTASLNQIQKEYDSTCLSTCEKWKLLDCYTNFTIEETCGMMECALDVVADCSEAEIKEMMMDENASLGTLEQQYAQICQGVADDCDFVGFAACAAESGEGSGENGSGEDGSGEDGGGEDGSAERDGEDSIEDLAAMCYMWDCMVSKLSGCDEEKLGSINMNQETMDTTKQAMEMAGC